VQDSISPEAWTALNKLRALFQRTPFREAISEAAAVRVTRRLATAATELVPQFFAVAANTLLADDGWRFCEIGKMLERAVITANSVCSISESLGADLSTKSMHASEIELSAFLRLLGTRDAYRRTYQTRAQPIPVLELLWQHPQVPRSVRHCLDTCRDLLRNSSAGETQASAPAAIDAFLHRLGSVDWTKYVPAVREDDQPDAGAMPATARPAELAATLQSLLSGTLEVHTVIADSFLNHQARIGEFAQPMSRERVKRR
jgi:uncharacterized alpha-E superfamily protein